MAYTITTHVAGIMPIANIDSGYTPANASAAIPSAPMSKGMIVQATDPTYGAGEFILLLGLAATAVGSLVRYNRVSCLTVLAAATAVQNTPVAVAMSANLAGTWGWYQISGTAVLSKTAVIVLPDVAVYLSATAGSVKAIASAGLQVCDCKSQLVTTASASATVLVTINRPSLQSQVT